MIKEKNITVLIATYNRWALVENLVYKLRKCNLLNIIIVNDAGELVPEDSFLNNIAKIVNLKNNSGQAVAIHEGAKLVESSHMLYIDSDDEVLIKCSISNLLNSLEEDHVYFPDTIKIRDKSVKRNFDQPLSDFNLRNNTIGTHSGFIISMKNYFSVGPYDSSLVSHIDWDYLIRLYKENIDFRTYEGDLLYSTETLGISRNLRRVFEGRKQLWAKHNTIFPKKYFFNNYFKLFKYAVGNCSQESWKNDDSFSFKIFILTHHIARLIYVSFIKLLNKSKFF